MGIHTPELWLGRFAWGEGYLKEKMERGFGIKFILDTQVYFYVHQQYKPTYF